MAEPNTWEWGEPQNRGAMIAAEVKTPKTWAWEDVYPGSEIKKQSQEKTAPSPIKDTVSALAQSLWEGITVHTPASIAAAYQGMDISDEGISGFLIDRSQQLQKERVAQPGGDAPSAIPGIKMKDVNELGQNIGFSLVSMAAGLAAGIPAGILGNLAAPGVGTVAGYAAGMGAAGRMAYNMDVNQVTNQLKDAANEESIKNTGQPMNPKEWQTKLNAMKGKIKEHGLWEAVPEAVGGAAGFAILTTAAKVFGKSVLARFTSKLGSLYGEEMLTESVTQIGQRNAEKAMGLHNDPERSFSSVDDWVASAKEVAPAVFLLTTLTAGIGKAAQIASGYGKEQIVVPENQDPVPQVTPPATTPPSEPSGGLPPIVGEFLLPTVEQARLDSQAMLAGQSVDDPVRLKNATLLSVYGENDAVRHVIESPVVFSAIGDSMLRIAPTVQKMRETIAKGQNKWDISEDAFGALDEITKVKSEGVKPADIFKQFEAMGQPMNQEQRQLLEFFHQNTKNAAALSEFMATYLRVARELGAPALPVEGARNIHKRLTAIELAFQNAKPLKGKPNAQTTRKAKPAPASTGTKLETGLVEGKAAVVPKPVEALAKDAGPVQPGSVAPNVRPAVQGKDTNVVAKVSGELLKLKAAKPPVTLGDIVVKVKAIEAETGKRIVMEEKADVALKDVNEQKEKARMLLECLRS